jgi:tRNA-2-methylthio-N6-dimethylallyladenosine synthase
MTIRDPGQTTDHAHGACRSDGDKDGAVSGKQLHIKNFGCQMNLHDAHRMAHLLADSHGYQYQPDPARADLIILNTCHVREKAEEKLFSELGRLRKLTEGRRDAVIFAVGGCVGQAEGTRIFQRAPFVNMVFGPQNYHRLPEFIDRLAKTRGRVCATDIQPDSKFDALPAARADGPIASVAVQEGCDKFCAFCVVPFTRGRQWSRPVADVLDEVVGLATQGVREFRLLGQNVNAYRAPDADGMEHDLALLIRRVALVAGVERIRFVTSHPADMTMELVELFAELPELCPYLHLPVQSGSDAVLERMGRGHTVAEYIAWVERLRAARPDIALATDFIVGFPGERAQDFQETLDLVETVGFDHAYSFQYSSRPGTAAAEWPDQIPHPEAAQRLARLQEHLNRQQLARNAAQVGRIVPVLVEGPSKRDPADLRGLTPDMRTVNFPGPPGWTGQTIQVRITRGLANSLRGERTGEIPQEHCHRG